MLNTNLKITIGADHKGYLLKKLVIEHLEKEHLSVVDEGTYDETSVDYPDFAKKVCQKVQHQEADFGILICYTGIGMSIVANKYCGIRAALVNSVENTVLTRNHNNANVICISAKDTSTELALQMIDTFLEEQFLGGRHVNRVNKITLVEKEEACK